MTKQIRRRCSHCHCYFTVCSKVKKHEFCGKSECQKARKRKWQNKKMEKDAQYRKDQYEANETWKQINPDYWKQYRSNNKKYTDENRRKQTVRNKKRRLQSSKSAGSDVIAKMDAMSNEKFLYSGKYRLVPLSSQKIAKMDAIIVELNVIPDS